LKAEQVAEWLEEWSRNRAQGTRMPALTQLAQMLQVARDTAYDGVLIAREAGWVARRGAGYAASRPPDGPTAPEDAAARPDDRAGDADEIARRHAPSDVHEGEASKWQMNKDEVRSAAIEGDKEARLTNTHSLAWRFDVDPAELRSRVLGPLTEEGWLNKVGRGEDYAAGPGPERPSEPAQRQAPPAPDEAAAGPPKAEPVPDTRWPTVLDEIVAANREARDELPSWDDYEPSPDDPADPSERSGPAQQPADTERRWDLDSPVEDPGDLDGPH
jgi:hypothetical protein